MPADKVKRLKAEYSTIAKAVKLSKIPIVALDGLLKPVKKVLMEHFDRHQSGSALGETMCALLTIYSTMLTVLNDKNIDVKQLVNDVPVKDLPCKDDNVSTREIFAEIGTLVRLTVAVMRLATLPDCSCMEMISMTFQAFSIFTQCDLPSGHQFQSRWASLLWWINDVLGVEMKCIFERNIRAKTFKRKLFNFETSSNQDFDVQRLLSIVLVMTYPIDKALCKEWIKLQVDGMKLGFRSAAEIFDITCIHSSAEPVEILNWIEQYRVWVQRADLVLGKDEKWVAYKKWYKALPVMEYFAASIWPQTRNVEFCNGISSDFISQTNSLRLGFPPLILSVIQSVAQTIPTEYFVDLISQYANMLEIFSSFIAFDYSVTFTDSGDQKIFMSGLQMLKEVEANAKMTYCGKLVTMITKYFLSTTSLQNRLTYNGYKWTFLELDQKKFPTCHDQLTRLLVQVAMVVNNELKKIPSNRNHGIITGIHDYIDNVSELLTHTDMMDVHCRAVIFAIKIQMKKLAEKGASRTIDIQSKRLK